MRCSIVLLSFAGLAAVACGCKRPARWGSSDAYAAAPAAAPSTLDGGLRVQSAITLAAAWRAYPVIAAPPDARLAVCIASYQASKTADDFGRIADDASCTLSDLARLRWAALVQPGAAATDLRRRYAELGTVSESEVLAARLTVARLLGDSKAVARDLAAGIDKGGLDRVEAYKELASLPAAARPSPEELQRLGARAWLGSPKRAKSAKLPPFVSTEASAWAELGRAWHGAGELGRAEDAWRHARTLASKKTVSLCALELVRGASYKHKGQAGFDAWSAADKACAGSDESPRSRYNLARATASIGKPQDARAAFLSLAAAFPTHRLADDALLKAASITRDLEGEEPFRLALLRIVDGPKDADMRDEALSLLYVSYARSGAWDKALQVATQLDARAGVDRVWSGGQAEYFRARALEALGRSEEAWSGYSNLLLNYPGAFYMRFAATRAHALKPNETADLWQKKRMADRTREVPWTAPAFPTSPCFSRASALAAVGELRRATEAGRSCAHADKGPGATLGLGVWYTQIGAFDKARALSLGGLLNTSVLPEDGNFLPWAILFPRAFEPLVREAAQREQVSPALVWGIMREESSFVPDVASPTGALGLMQLMPGTAVEVAKGTPWSADAASLKTPAGNIPLGTRLLGHLNRKYAGNEVLVASAYNAGEAATDRWLAKRSPADFDLWVEEIPYEETFGYVRRVASSAAVYRATHLGESALADYMLYAPTSPAAPAAASAGAPSTP